MRSTRRHHACHFFSMVLLICLAACGGGGGGGVSTDSPTLATSVSPSVLAASSSLENNCTPSGEKQFIRSYLDEKYLWYSEVAAIDASLYATVTSYFHALLVTTPDASGVPKDRFSFVLGTTDADSLSTGVNVGYGVEWRLDEFGRQRVSFVTAGSPADLAGLARGGQMVQVLSGNGNSWYPNAAGAWVQFLYSDTPGGTVRTVILYAGTVQENPVPQVAVVASPMGTPAGYLLFNDHSAGAQDKLISAVQSLQTQGIRELVLDMRYNSGGYLYVAQTLASMVSDASANGKVFEALHFNDKRAADSASNIYRFSSAVEYGESVYPVGYALPRLNMRRVYLLTGDSTCSASEAVINGLRGVDIEVILVGSRTCGKPYGFARKNNCGRAYYPIEFQGTNDKNFGGYSTGFAPTCTVSDDVGHALGLTQEGQLAAALYHMDHGVCAPATSVARTAQARGTVPTGPLLSETPRHARGRLLLPTSP
jgi:carboxyl-terminal processing protease